MSYRLQIAVIDEQDNIIDKTQTDYGWARLQDAKNWMHATFIFLAKLISLKMSPESFASMTQTKPQPKRKWRLFGKSND